MRDELPERYFYHRKKISSIGQLLKNALPKKSFINSSQQGVIKAWKEAVTETVYQSTKITGIKNGMLYVNVESSAMIHYLTNFEKRAIISKINKAVGSKYIEDICFRAGTIR